jgi:hypothetical protein
MGVDEEARKVIHSYQDSRVDNYFGQLLSLESAQAAIRKFHMLFSRDRPLLDESGRSGKHGMLPT